MHGDLMALQEYNFEWKKRKSTYITYVDLNLETLLKKRFESGNKKENIIK